MEKFWGDEVGWEKVVCWITKAAISLKRVKVEEKLLWRAYRKSQMLFRLFGSSPYFYFRFCLYSHQDGQFCLVFAHTSQQWVLDGKNGLSSFKPYAYCRIVHRADIFAIAQLSCLRCTQGAMHLKIMSCHCRERAIHISKTNFVTCNCHVSQKQRISRTRIVDFTHQRALHFSKTNFVACLVFEICSLHNAVSMRHISQRPILPRFFAL